MQNLETSRTKLRNGHSQSKTAPFRPCTVSSSSSDAANPPAKKGKKLRCQHPSPAKTQRSNPYLHEDYYHGEIRIKPQVSKSQQKKPIPPSQPCLSREKPCEEGEPGTSPINTELSRGTGGGIQRKKEKTERIKTEGEPGEKRRKKTEERKKTKKKKQENQEEIERGRQKQKEQEKT